MKDDNISKNNNNKIKEKLLLNKKLDLYKIPIKVLKETKLSEYRGHLINDILYEMLSSENININKVPDNNKSNIFPNKKNGTIVLRSHSFKRNKRLNILSDSKPFRIERIIFQIKYNTNYGEELALAGSINELGNWDPFNALKLQWNEGNIWKACIHLKDNNLLDFEYKFIFLCDGRIQKWEDGNNRKYIFSQIKGLIDSCTEKGDIIHLKNIQGQNIDYNYNDNTLTIISEWNKK